VLARRLGIVGGERQREFSWLDAVVSNASFEIIGAARSGVVATSYVGNDTAKGIAMAPALPLSAQALARRWRRSQHCRQFHSLARSSKSEVV
jgi:hypothetical protein